MHSFRLVAVCALWWNGHTVILNRNRAYGELKVFLNSFSHALSPKGGALANACVDVD